MADSADTCAGGAAPAGSFQLQLLPMHGLAAALQNLGSLEQATGQPQLHAAAGDPVFNVLQQFPGPLSASTPRDKVTSCSHH